LTTFVHHITVGLFAIRRFFLFDLIIQIRREKTLTSPSPDPQIA
jgi:hypothetical protein